MGRRKQFDEARALEEALDLFWRRGWLNTSVQELVEVMGINRFSLYATFGDKEAIFLRALRLYRDRWRQVIVERLGSSPSPRAGLVALLEEMARQIGSDHLGRGCFIVNSAGELSALPFPAQTLVKESLLALEATVARAIARAQAAGEIDPCKDADALARLIVAAVNGARGLWKLDKDPAKVAALLQLTLAQL